MRLGAVLPHHGFGNDRAAIKDLALGIEALGFDHLVAYDHVLGAEPGGRRRHLPGRYGPRHEFHEPFVLFGFLGGVTESVELVVGVLVAPQRQTALVAKQAAEVQALSGGRLRLGLGTGWNFAEYDSLGADFERRGAMLDEQVHVLRELWGRPLVSFDGRFHQLDRVGIRPLPERRIPVWFGGYTGAALRRSAAHGDGHLFGHLRPSELDAARTLHELVAAAGRSPAEFGMEAIVDVSSDPGRRARGRWPLARRRGNPPHDPHDRPGSRSGPGGSFGRRAPRPPRTGAPCAARRSDVTPPPDRRQTPSDRSAT